MPLNRRPEPFSHADWLFEIKYDGFRALAYVDPSGVRLVSEKGNRLTSFADLCSGIELFLKVKHAILDGEIVCIDDQGHSQFNELLFRRGTPNFSAFDLLHLNGKDLRNLPLIERKRALRKLIESRQFRLSALRGPHRREWGAAIRPSLRARLGGHRAEAPPEPLFDRGP